MILQRLTAILMLLWPTLAWPANFQQAPRRPQFGSHSNRLAYVQTCEVIHASTFTTTIDIGATGNCSNGATQTNPHAGNLEFIWVGYSGTPTSITGHTDTLGNTWTCTTDAATTFQVECYSVLTTGGSADTFTLTSSSAQQSAVVSLEISGPNATPLDGSPQFGTTGAGTTWTLPANTTGNANDVVIGCATNHTANVTFTAGSGYTIPFSNYAGGANPSGACEAQIVTSTSTYTPTITVGTSSSGAGMTIAFKSS